MNRRGFLGLLAGVVLDPERLLWVPGRKLISIPQPKHYTAVQLIYDANRRLMCEGVFRLGDEDCANAFDELNALLLEWNAEEPTWRHAAGLT
jgi:hypothetical protein